MSTPGPEPNQDPDPRSDAAIGASAQRKAAIRLLPIISIGYGLAYMDRINISFASLRMNSDLHFSATVYGLGAGLFFIGYALCEVPSNLLLLRFGPKRWLARIMLTWGLLAAAMMFVRTPWQFYSVRLLLGMAEAGFFPGVIYYLTLWFPAKMRARAVSRFYIALPLSSVLMGAVAGWLMGLQGKLGLAGWQWLFLLEGLPATLFSFVFLWILPDGPMQAEWLTAEERMWLKRQLDSDSVHAHLGHEAGVLQALLSPKVWMIGAYFLCALTANYAYYFSAPVILQEATGWSVTNVGFLIAGFGLAGAAGMLLNGAHSDRTGERAFHCIIPCIIMGAGYLTASYSRVPWLIVASLGVELRRIHVDAGAGTRGAHAVSGRSCRGSRHRRDEHHHHVQRLYRTLLDGRDKRCDRQLLAGPARARRAKSRCGARHVRADAQPRANVRDRHGSQRSQTAPPESELRDE